MKENYILRIKLDKTFYQNIKDDQDGLKGLIESIENFLYESQEYKGYHYFLDIDLQDGYDIKTSVTSSFKDCKTLKNFLIYQDQDAFEKLNIERIY